MAADIPASTACVRVSLIDTGARLIKLNTSAFVHPVPSNLPFFPDAPSYSFLIQHPSGKTYLFDLSVRKDWKSGLPTKSLEAVWDNGWQVEVPAGVDETLVAGGVDLATINGVIWSHWHWDHVGDVALFPLETELVVGQGFKDAYMPVNWPTKADGSINETAWANRKVQELDFSGGLKVLGHEAVDFFGDGSFYLLRSSGHTLDHTSGLARTTSNSFILMGGDTCHYPGQYRPTSAVPIPAHIEPHPFHAISRHVGPCPGALFASVHPAGKLDEPFYTLVEAADGGMNHNRMDALRSREKLITADGMDEIWVVIAHDGALLGNVNFFPDGDLNAWKEKGWKASTKWRFLGDFKQAVEKEGTEGGKA